MSNNPYNSPSDQISALPAHLQSAPKQGMSGGKVALIVFGILGGLALLCCLCGFGVWFFSINILASAVKTQFGDHPHVQREIGPIESISFKFGASVTEQSNSSSNTFVFDVSGPNGSGQIVVSDQVGDAFNEAELRTGSDVFDLME